MWALKWMEEVGMEGTESDNQNSGDKKFFKQNNAIYPKLLFANKYVSEQQMPDTLAYLD